MQSLESLDGFNSLDSIEKYIEVRNNPKLKTLDGLEFLKILGSHLTIAGNDVLESVSALENLTEINEYLAIAENPTLENLFGFENCVLENNITQLYIENNTTLRYCDIKSICNYLNANGNAVISGNSIDCNSDSEIIQACSITAVDNANSATKRVLIFPNPSKGSFSIKDIDEFKELKIFDQLGRLVRKISVENNSRIDVNQLGKGLYQLYLTNYQNSHSEMIMVY